MSKAIKLYMFIIFAGIFSNSYAQQCPTLISPFDGDLNVPVDNIIRWTEVEGIIGYLVSLGTTPGGGEIINRRSSGLNNFYQPEVGLPENTVIYVTISLFLPDAPIKVCPLQIFTTVAVTEPPECTSLSEPINNEIEVRVDEIIRWTYAPTATNYLISLGSTSGVYDIVENYETGNVLFFKPEQNLELNQTYYFRVIPFNENGEALGCSEEQFTTGEPTIRCEEIDFPILSFPDVISLCRGSDFSSIRTDSRARGYRWIKINTNGEEEIISEINEFEYNEAGTYRLELYNIITEFGASIECPVVKEFEVVYSEEPIIQDVLVSRQTNGLRIEIRVESSGNFEYSLTNEISGYQDSPIFYNVPPGERKVYVRDKNGCGITQRLVEKELSADDFPAFFTPNGDGNNDYWQYKKNEGSAELNIEYIQIYDRYGNFLAQVNPLSKGWSGTYQGRELPESDYWFKAISFSQKEIKGHFTLKR